jgi:hypothetical protein
VQYMASYKQFHSNQDLWRRKARQLQIQESLKCHDLPQTSIFCGKICDAEKLANYHSSHSRQQILDLHLTIMDVLLRLGGLVYPDNIVIKKPIWLLVSIVQLGAWSS